MVSQKSCRQDQLATSSSGFSVISVLTPLYSRAGDMDPLLCIDIGVNLKASIAHETFFALEP